MSDETKQNGAEVPGSGYFLKDNLIFRDGEPIGENTPDGVMMYGGFENYKIQAVKLVRQFEEEKKLPPPLGSTAPVNELKRPEKIRTVGELIRAMQPYVGDPCPPMVPWLGDETPEVQDWIREHDDVRTSVLKQYNGEV